MLHLQTHSRLCELSSGSVISQQQLSVPASHSRVIKEHMQHEAWQNRGTSSHLFFHFLQDRYLH